jgi:hypothetical protein
VSLDLAKAHFVIGIGGGFQAHDMFVIVAGFVTELLAHVDHGAHMHFGHAGRQRTHDLRRAGAALEMYRIGTTERARIVHQCEFGHATVVIGIVVHPGDKIVPAGGLLIDRASFEIFAEETAAIG